MRACVCVCVCVSVCVCSKAAGRQCRWCKIFHGGLSQEKPQMTLHTFSHKDPSKLADSIKKICQTQFHLYILWVHNSAHLHSEQHPQMLGEQMLFLDPKNYTCVYVCVCGECVCVCVVCVYVCVCRCMCVGGCGG